MQLFGGNLSPWRRVLRPVRPFFLALVLSACAATPHRATSPHRAASDHAPAWQPLSAEVFEEAERRNVFVLLSLQADWCHFCHVMNDSTFADGEVLEVLASDFITVREEADRRPDLVARWGLYGWPATIVLDAEGRELVALRGYRERDAFLSILRALVADRDAGRVPGSSLPAAIRSGAPAPSDGVPVEGMSELRAGLERRLDALYDQEEDGWGTPQKYPFGALVEHALLRGERSGEPLHRDRALATLGRHLSLIDPVWGGMYQYSVEGDWDHPHYEKLGALQASALSSFAAALTATSDARWSRSGDAILRYLGDHLRSPKGTFFVAQDADVRAGEASMTGAVFYGLDAEGRAALGVAPHIDTHVDADVNGMLISALARYGFAAGDARALAWANTAADAIWASHCDIGEAGCAHEVDGDTEASAQRHLADQAAMLAACVELHQVSAPGETRHLERARALAALIRSQFTDEAGGLRATPAREGEVDLASSVRPFVPGAVAARALLILDRLDEGHGHADAARAALLALSDPEVLARQGRIVGEFLLALELAIEGTVHFALVGEDDDPRTEALLDAVQSLYQPRRVLDRLLPSASPYGDPGEPALFLCGREACSFPITEPAELASSVEAFLASE